MDEVQALKLGQTELQAPVTLSGVDKLGEQLGRRIRALIEPMAGGKPTVTAQDTETVNYDLWSAMAPSFSALSVYKLHPLKGSVLVSIDPALVSALVDRFYGGAGGKLNNIRAEFSPSEERIIVKLADGIMAALVTAWSDILALEHTLVSRETDPQALSLGDSNDQMLVQQFRVNLGGKDQEWPIDLIFPVVALRQLEPLMATGDPDEKGHPDPLWRARLAHQMQNIRLPARTVLARPTLNIDQLLALKPGDVIPVNLNRNIPLIVEHRVLDHGTIGEQNGHAAFRIEKLS